MLVEFELAKPNKKIKGVKYKWIDVCTKNRCVTSAKILVHRGEKNGPFKKEDVKKLRKEININTLYKYRQAKGTKHKIDIQDEGKEKMWRKFFETKFAKGRKQFGFKSELALFCDQFHQYVLFQHGTYFTPFAASEFFTSIPLHEDWIEFGIRYKDDYYMVLQDFYLQSVMSCTFASLLERKKKLKPTDCFEVKHRDEVAKKEKKKVFSSSLETAFVSKGFFDIPDTIKKLLSMKVKELESEKFDNVDIVDGSKLKEKGELKVEGNKAKGKAVLIMKTNKVIYMVLLEGTDAYKTRSCLNYLDQILEKLKKKDL